MKKLILAAALTLVPAAASAAAPAHRPAAAHARGVADPRAFVAQRYAAYLHGSSAHIPAEPTWLYSPRLAALNTRYMAWQRRHSDDVGIDFDWWINGQDWELSALSITSADNGPNERTITSHFRNTGTPEVIDFKFVRIGGLWYLDDVVHAGTGDEGWSLANLLAHPGV